MAEDTQERLEVPRLPFEGDETSVDAASKSLFNLLADDVDTHEKDEPGSEEKEDEDQDADDDTEEESDEDDSEEDDDGESEDEDESDDSDDEEHEDQPSYKVKVDGKEVEVTLDELKKGYSRQADYTRKTQELAEERKVLSEAREAREQYQQRLQAVDTALEQAKPKGRTADEWDSLRRRDPNRFAVEWAEHQRWQTEKAAVQQEQERVAQEAQGDLQRQINDTLKREGDLLVEVIPEWQDKDTAATEKAELMQYAQETYGWTEEDLASVYDHRLILMLRKAQQFDALSEGAERLEPKKKTAKVLKPGGRKKKTGKTKAQRKRAEKLARSGSVDDAAALIMGALGDDD